ncbi:MAG: dATP/dGTP pyrophosphohydrolase domain-containing protein [Kordiimonas sp.]
MKTETQKSVAEWAEQTFGPAKDHSVLVTRAISEMEELLEAVENNDTAEIGKEAADVAILLWRLMEQNGLDLSQEIMKKMQENRTREWAPKGDGTGKHIA